MITEGKFVQIRDIQNKEWLFNVDYISNMRNEVVSYDVQLAPSGHFTLDANDGLHLITHWKYWVNNKEDI